jgi:hypothetical protein
LFLPIIAVGWWHVQSYEDGIFAEDNPLEEGYSGLSIPVSPIYGNTGRDP